ncbi:uncharacterized protein LOC128220235 isoform X2 [Mya arenaria]|uniref:uncharacterized protein LOC128220235 isoform X2 n=1 Tax=Mya arenaria TaxID=6604 RepID=UPI0022E9092F|nr:uncharacterized protein LOC128220235 isoform X2 [Mya arenaria]
MKEEFAFIVILFHMFCIWVCARAETVTISSDTCGDYFDFGSDSFDGPDVTVLYKGDPVTTRLEDGCYIELYNWDSQKTICMDVLTMNINSCRTNVSIYRNIISKYLEPEQVQANLNMDNRRLDIVHTSPIQTQINTNRLLLRPHQRWEEMQPLLGRIFTIRTHHLRPMKTA